MRRSVLDPVVGRELLSKCHCGSVTQQRRSPHSWWPVSSKEWSIRLSGEAAQIECAERCSSHLFGPVNERPVGREWLLGRLLQLHGRSGSKWSIALAPARRFTQVAREEKLLDHVAEEQLQAEELGGDEPEHTPVRQRLTLYISLELVA